MATPDAPRPERPPRPCPICKKMSIAAFHPFCSKRCADVDLSRWFKGVYAVPAQDQGQDDDAEEDGQTLPPTRDSET